MQAKDLINTDLKESDIKNFDDKERMCFDLGCKYGQDLVNCTQLHIDRFDGLLEDGEIAAVIMNGLMNHAATILDHICLELNKEGRDAVYDTMLIGLEHAKGQSND